MSPEPGVNWTRSPPSIPMIRRVRASVPSSLTLGLPLSGATMNGAPVASIESTEKGIAHTPWSSPKR